MLNAEPGRKLRIEQGLVVAQSTRVALVARRGAGTKKDKAGFKGIKTAPDETAVAS